ncbi:MAG: hypothetical protein RL676_270, partial [Pseudomonadota bacterium]
MAKAVLKRISLLRARGNVLRWAALSLPVLALLG